MAFNRPYLPDYFDESAMKPEDKALLTKEKALQKALSKDNMKAYALLTDDCNAEWRKLLNTDKMREGRRMSERSYQIALNNLHKIKG